MTEPCCHVYFMQMCNQSLRALVHTWQGRCEISMEIALTQFVVHNTVSYYDSDHLQVYCILRKSEVLAILAQGLSANLIA